MVVSASGTVWRGDNWFSGGEATYDGPPLALIPETLHTGQRQGNFDYAIPLANAPYELRLYFGPRSASKTEPAPSARGFDVLANGVKLLDGLDPEGCLRRVAAWMVAESFDELGCADLV